MGRAGSVLWVWVCTGGAARAAFMSAANGAGRVTARACVRDAMREEKSKQLLLAPPPVIMRVMYVNCVFCGGVAHRGYV